MSIGLWLATGAEGYTRWPDSKLNAADAEASQEQIDLLADIGFASVGDPAESEPEIQSRFAFGLVPGGLNPKHLLSVASSLSCGFAIIGIALILDRMKRHD